MRQRIQKQKSFTLVEIMAAISILGVLSISVVKMHEMGARMTAFVQQEIELWSLMQYKVEELKSKPFSQNVGAAGQTIPGYSKYSFAIFDTSPYLGNPYLKRIQVSCTYTTPFNTAQSETVVFLVANLP